MKKELNNNVLTLLGRSSSEVIAVCSGSTELLSFHRLIFNLNNCPSSAVLYAGFFVGDDNIISSLTPMRTNEEFAIKIDATIGNPGVISTVSAIERDSQRP